jgi:hypothetical protein
MPSARPILRLPTAARGGRLPDTAQAGEAAAAVWVAADGSVLSAARSAGDWQAPIVLVPRSERPIRPRIALNPAGDAVAVWGDLRSRACARRRRPDGTWGPTTPLSPPGGGAAGTRIAVGANGAATAVWVDHTATVQLCECSPTGRWGLSRAIDTGYLPDVAASETGTVVVWMSAEERIRAMRRRPGDRWSDPEDLSPAGAFVSFPSVSVDADGVILVAWLGHDRRVHMRGGTIVDGWSDGTVAADSQDLPHVTAGADGLRLSFGDPAVDFS